jgi:hypothetical protein
VNYQILIDKEESILQKTLLSSLEGNSEMNRNITPNKTDKQVDFLLCPSCFWCASYLNFGELSVVRCPICHNSRVDQLPVSISMERNAVNC